MPISDSEVRDPRIRRTRQLLQGALHGLLLTRNFEEISVQDIAEAATVNRATFYDHYSDKFALLDALIGGGFHQLLRERNVEFNPDCAEAAGAIILAACDYQLLIHQGSGGCKGQSPFEPLVDAAITGAIRRVLVRDIRDLGANSSLSAEMAASAASAAIYSASKEWFRAANRPPVEEVVPQIVALILPILEQTSEPSESTRPAPSASHSIA